MQVRVEERLQRLEERLRRIEDREKIRELCATYCFLVDDGRFEELVETCFSADAEGDFHGAGDGMARFVSRGREELRRFFAEAVPGLLRNMSHTVHNHRITVDGDEARGECYFELTATDNASGEDVVGAGRYLDRYRRAGDGWRFVRREAEIFHIAPLSRGWSRQRFIAGLEPPSAAAAGISPAVGVPKARAHRLRPRARRSKAKRQRNARRHAR